MPDLVRDAVSHIFDPGYLNAHPLAAALAPGPGSPAPGIQLRQLLVEAKIGAGSFMRALWTCCGDSGRSGQWCC